MPLVCNNDASAWCPTCVCHRGADTCQHLQFITYYSIKNKVVCIIVLGPMHNINDIQLHQLNAFGLYMLTTMIVYKTTI